MLNHEQRGDERSESDEPERPVSHFAAVILFAGRCLGANHASTPLIVGTLITLAVRRAEPTENASLLRDARPARIAF